MKRIPLDQLRQSPDNLWHEAFAAGRLVDGVAVEVPDEFPHLAPAKPVAAVQPSLAPSPLAAPAEVATARLAICQPCEHNTGGQCRLFGCCPKDLTQTVNLALQQCPIGRWPRFFPTPKPANPNPIQTMKKTAVVLISISAFSLSAWPIFAQVQYINLTALTTNTAVSSGGQITIPSVCSNAPYSTVKTNNLIVGDPLSSAFAKVNATFSYSSNQFNSLSNNLALVTNALGVFLATGEMRFDAGKITSDGNGNVSMTGNLFTQTNATDAFYFGADPANPGVAATAWHQGVESAQMEMSPNVATLFTRPNLNGSPVYSIIYLDDTGVAALSGANNSSGFWANADGTVTVIDTSGAGQHFDGSGNVAFDGNVSFAGGAAAITPDTFGNGGTTLMLQASDTGAPMYLHVNSSGALTVTTSP